MAQFEYKMDLGGVEEICKSGAVQTELNRLAEQKCDEANKLMNEHGITRALTSDHGVTHIPLAQGDYQVKSKILDHTAISQVAPGSGASAYDQYQNHTLNAINH